jgi:hypothetical protein
MPGALDPAYISANQFPKTFAYIDRFNAALKTAQSAMARPVRLPIQDVISHMSTSRFYESVGDVDANDPLALQPGDEVTTGPTDTGVANRDTGRLVTLTPNQITIAKQTKDNFEIHVHMPRWGFRVYKAKGGKM